MRYLLAALLMRTACSKRDVIVIGMDATYPPFEFVDENLIVLSEAVGIFECQPKVYPRSAVIVVRD